MNELSEEHLELVRYWRNSPEISSKMEYRNFITHQMQLSWYKSLDLARDFYYIIEYKDIYIGLINTSKIDEQDKSAQAGLFIWDHKYHDTHIPVLASLAMLDVFFDVFHINKIYAKVLKTNNKAIRYNTNLGFRLMPEQANQEFQNYFIDKSNYRETAHKIWSIAQRKKNQLSSVTMRQNEFDQLCNLLKLDPKTVDLKDSGGFEIFLYPK